MPTIITARTSASARKDLRPIDDHFGFSHGMAGFERLYKSGKLAIVHGCGYENPSFSHFTSMAYWHTAAPNSGEQYGWVGRLADAMAPDAPPNFIVEHRYAPIARGPQPAPCAGGVRRSQQVYARNLLRRAWRAANPLTVSQQISNPSRRFLLETAQSAKQASALVREAWSKYHSPVDYGVVGLDLPKVAALIDAGMPTRLYYTAYRNNAFDTHVFQNDTHKRLLTYASDAVAAFHQDLERIGRADDVVVMVFSEFGRRVPENVNLGTDHGAANLMFVAGKQVKGGQYGNIPSLTKLDVGDNLMLHYRFPASLRDHDRGMAGAERYAPAAQRRLRAF